MYRRCVIFYSIIITKINRYSRMSSCRLKYFIGGEKLNFEGVLKLYVRF